jgi:hypothetical protein
MASRFDAGQNLPDLMPIMFPSGDPFAYPTQPMSTLEDGHFKQERPGSSTQYFGDNRSQSGHQIVTPTGLPNENAPQKSIPAFDTFQGLHPLPGNVPGRLSTTLPPQFHHLGMQSQGQSPGSHSSTPGSNDTVNSPDLVSLPHNVMWQGLGFPTQSTSTSQPASQPQTSSANDVQYDNMGMSGFSPMGMGMGMDMNVNLDDVFGNMGGSNTYPTNDDWSQWMNVGV